jgi:hypothetical protein
MAAQYRALADCFLNGAYVHAGEVVTFSGVPGPYLDPLTPEAVTAFYNAGPQATVLVRPQWTGQPAVPAVTYWRSLPAMPRAGAGPRWSDEAFIQWELVGLGRGLPPIAF